LLQAEQKTTNPSTTLAAELCQLERKCATFNAFYACFCDALAKVLVEDQVLDKDTIDGIKRSSHWLKLRLAELQAELESIGGHSE
jgi:hypothetical protein